MLWVMAERNGSKAGDPVERARDTSRHNSTRFFDPRFRVVERPQQDTSEKGMPGIVDSLKRLIPGWEPPPAESDTTDT